MRGQQRDQGGRGRDEEKRETRKKKREQKRNALWMGCTTRYRPRRTGEKTEKREAPVETSAETSNEVEVAMAGEGGESRCRRMKPARLH